MEFSKCPRRLFWRERLSLYGQAKLYKNRVVENSCNLTRVQLREIIFVTTQFLILFGTSLAVVATLYTSFAIFLVLPGLRRSEAVALKSPNPPPGAIEQRPLSVLKPLCGDEPGLYENLRSFCMQSYPSFQLLFGVQDTHDPAVATVRRLQSEFPLLDLKLVVDSRVHGTNLKVSNLLNILPHAEHDWLLLADSDIGVARDHFSRVTPPLADPKVGVVTCLYRGVPRAGFWSRLGAQFINDWFAPSVRISHALGSTRFCSGATIALRRETLDAVGGFASLRNTLADDFALAEMTRRKGLRTILSDVLVTTDVIENRWSELWNHELRWLRTVRGLEPKGFMLIFVTFTFPMLAIGLALSRTKFCFAVCCLGVAARLFLHCIQRERKIALTVIDDFILPPLRDLLLFIEWIVALTGTRVHWRKEVLDASTRASARGFLFLLCMISAPLVG